MNAKKLFVHYQVELLPEIHEHYTMQTRIADRRLLCV
jgi:hypothetical protein